MTRARPVVRRSVTAAASTFDRGVGKIPHPPSDVLFDPSRKAARRVRLRVQCAVAVVALDRRRREPQPSGQLAGSEKTCTICHSGNATRAGAHYRPAVSLFAAVLGLRPRAQPSPPFGPCRLDDALLTT